MFRDFWTGWPVYATMARYGNHFYDYQHRIKNGGAFGLSEFFHGHSAKEWGSDLQRNHIGNLVKHYVLYQRIGIMSMIFSFDECLREYAE